MGVAVELGDEARADAHLALERARVVVRRLPDGRVHDEDDIVGLGELRDLDFDGLECDENDDDDDDVVIGDPAELAGGINVAKTATSSLAFEHARTLHRLGAAARLLARVAALRTGTPQWLKPEPIVRALIRI